MRVLTSLVKTLDKGGLVDRSGANLQSKAFIFDRLFKPQTNRIITDVAFCTFGQDLVERLSTEERTEFSKRVHDKVFGAAWWLEFDPLFALWADGGTVFRVQKKVIAKGVFCEKLAALYTEDPDAEMNARKTMYAYIMAFLYAQEQLPARLTERAETSFAIPKFLRDQAPKFQLFNSIYLRGYQKAANGEHSVLDISGRRWHFVRAHWMMPQNKTERVWRKSCWRGDPALGVIRKVYIAKGVPA